MNFTGIQIVKLRNACTCLHVDLAWKNDSTGIIMHQYNCAHKVRNMPFVCIHDTLPLSRQIMCVLAPV